MVPESQPSFGSLASLCTRQQELNCPNILSYSYRWSSPTPPWAFYPKRSFNFSSKAPFLDEQFQQNLLCYHVSWSSLLELEGPFARESNPLILKMKCWSPAISFFVQGHGEQHGRELHLGCWLLQRCLQLHPILVLIHAKTQPRPQQILFTFRVVVFYCYFTARGKKRYIFTRQAWLQSRSPSPLWLFKASHANSPCEWQRKAHIPGIASQHTRAPDEYWLMAPDTNKSRVCS